MKKLLTALLLVICFPAFAQHTVRGTITDNQGEVAAGVVIYNPALSSSAISDGNGNFEIRARKGDVLQFSCLGLASKEVTVNLVEERLAVVMEIDASMIEETVVVGYGVTKKRDLAGSVSQIKTEDVRAGQITSTAQLIKGRAAGVYVRQRSDAPGGSISIRVRGASSISSNNEPLYVIDGVQCDNCDDLYPDDIASIEIMKDASSTAIFGARGANGVVIITTKRGSKGRVNVSYSFGSSVKSVVNPYELMDAEETIAYNMKIWRENGSSGASPHTESEQAYKGPGTDWIKTMTRQSFSQTHVLQASGGSDMVTASATISYQNDLGTIQNTSYSRLGTRGNIEIHPNDRIKAGLNLSKNSSKNNYFNLDLNGGSDNLILRMLIASPFNTLNDDGTNIFGEPTRKEAAFFELMYKDMNIATDNSSASFYVDTEFLKGLSLHAQYSTMTQNVLYQNFHSKQTIYGSSLNGAAKVSNAKDEYRQAEAVITYHNLFGGKHDLKIIAGSNWLNFVDEGSSMTAHSFSTESMSFYNMGAAEKIDEITSIRNEKTNLSFFARAEYVLGEKYIFNASFRADGASNFGKNNKWGYFPSVSAAWQLGDEPFMDFAKPVLESLKLRASWGVTGNDGIGMYKSLRTYAFRDIYLGGSAADKMMYMSNVGNAALKWESTRQMNIGMDFSLWKGRLSGSFDVYDKLTNDLINPINISASNYGVHETIGNLGNVRNRGWELFLKGNIVSKRLFSWTSTLNISQNKNKVEKLSAPSYFELRPAGGYSYQQYMILKEGEAMGSIYGYEWVGILQKGEEYAAQPKAREGDPLFKDISGPDGVPDGVIDAFDRTVIGKGTPDIVLGWGHDFRIGDFDISLFFDGAFGNQLLNLTKLILEDNNRLDACMDRWTVDNASTSMIKTKWATTGGVQYGSYINTHFVEDASYIRLSNLELGYTLPVDRMRLNYIKGMRVYVGGQRLLTFTKYSGFDPEANSSGTDDILQGVDYCSYPGYRTFNFGAKITF
ncbi:MAG: TonB-dependent receptor [Bacteroidales bacterium]|nr:TonB-dependent receptor [Bacteroidales bacterium]